VLFRSKIVDATVPPIVIAPLIIATSTVFATLEFVTDAVKPATFSKTAELFPTLLAFLTRLFLPFFPAALPTNDASKPFLWVVDSGANRHYSFVLSNFNVFVHRDDLRTVSGINCPILGTGNIPVSTVDHQVEPVHFFLLNVLYAPSLSELSCGNCLRLFSVRLVDASLIFTF